MDIPTPPAAVAALAGFLRQRLAEVSDSLAPLWRRDGSDRLPARPDASALGAARQLATAVVGAAAPFAPTPYARARLLRQMHASGLLTDEEVRRTRAALDESPGELPAGRGVSGAPW